MPSTAVATEQNLVNRTDSQPSWPRRYMSSSNWCVLTPGLVSPFHECGNIRIEPCKAGRERGWNNEGFIEERTFEPSHRSEGKDYFEGQKSDT